MKRVCAPDYPPDWILTEFGHAACLVMGQSPKGFTYLALGQGVPLLNGPAEFGRRYPIPVQSTTSPTRLARSGDILFCVRGNTTGKMNIADRTYCIGRGLAAIRGDDSRTDTAFLKHALTYLKPTIYSIALGGGSTFPNISKSDLESLQVRLPPLAEQRHIAAVLSATERAIERQERLIALTSELKKALMHKLFTEGTRGEPLKQTEAGLVPQGWTLARVGELCNLVSGGTPSKANASFWKGTIPWASPKDMKLSRLADTQDHLTQRAVEEGSRLVPAGSIFVVIRGMILMRDVPVAQASVPMAFNQDMKALINHRGVTSDFLLYALQHARDRLLHKVGSSAHGTRTLMTSALEQLRIAVPSATEQEVISAALRLVEDKNANHHRQRASLQDLFQALLHQLMTSQVRVVDVDLSDLAEVSQSVHAAA